MTSSETVDYCCPRRVKYTQFNQCVTEDTTGVSPKNPLKQRVCHRESTRLSLLRLIVWRQEVKAIGVLEQRQPRMVGVSRLRSAVVARCQISRRTALGCSPSMISLVV